MRAAGAQIPLEKRLRPFTSTTVQVGLSCLMRRLRAASPGESKIQSVGTARMQPSRLSTWRGFENGRTSRVSVGTRRKGKRLELKAVLSADDADYTDKKILFSRLRS